MAKTRLSAASKKWFGGGIAVQQPAQLTKNNDGDKKMKVTLYVSKEAWRILWRRRAETGVTLSKTFEELIIKHLGKPKGA